MAAVRVEGAERLGELAVEVNEAGFAEALGVADGLGAATSAADVCSGQDADEPALVDEAQDAGEFDFGLLGDYFGGEAGGGVEDIADLGEVAVLVVLALEANAGSDLGVDGAATGAFGECERHFVP